jgi:hypothetical protein
VEVEIRMRFVLKPRDNHGESICIGSPSTMFLLEMMANLMCTELLLSKNVMKRTIHICSASRASIAALAKTTTELTLVG